jgi:3-hydroxybutyrate dehydrogenase
MYYKVSCSPLRQVFAGLLDPTGGSPSVKILKAIELERQKEDEPGGAGDGDPQQSEAARARGQIVPLELDPTREDSLRACLDAVRAKLPAGEDGKTFYSFSSVSFG